MKIPYDLIGKFLSGEATEEEIAALMKWRNAHEAHENEYLLTVAGWRHSFNDEARYEHSREEAFRQTMEAISAKERKSVLRPLLKVAAAIFVLVSVFAIYRMADQTGEEGFIRLSSGDEVKTVMLADGSTVWLNKNSALIYPEDFTKQERSVKLEGEGYFEVAKDPGRPFVIVAGKSKTTVLGTAFNIEVKDYQSVELSVTEGKVRFSDLKETVAKILTVGEKALLEPETGLIEKKVALSANAVSWKTKTLVFEKTPLLTAVDDLKKYYAIDIVLEDHTLEDTPVTFTLERKPLDYAIELLENLTGLTVTKKENTYYITR